MKYKIIPLFLTVALAANAQTYSLSDLYELAEQNSKTIQIARDGLSSASESAAGARTTRLPDIEASLSVGYNGNGLITDRDFSNAMNVHIPDFANNFSLKVSQVLYAGGAISSGIRLGEMGERMAELNVMQQRQEVRFYIVGQYLDICRTLCTIKVLEQNIVLARELMSNLQGRAQSGVALQNDITRHDLHIKQLELQLRRLRDAYSILNRALCRTVGLPDDTQIMPDYELPGTEVISPEQNWQEEAGKGSIILQESELASKMAEQRLSLSKSSRLPQLAIVAENHLNGPITIEIPAINKNFNYWFVGVGIQYNFSSLYKARHDVKRARSDYDQSSRQQALAAEHLNVAVHSAHTELLTAVSEMQTCQTQVELAEENYSIVSSRYSNGLALLTDILDAANTKLQSETALEQSRIDILYSQKKLEYLSGRL